MGIESGSAFLLKVGDGGVPPAYATIAGLRTTQLSINGEGVNVTTKDSGGWRELLSGAGPASPGGQLAQMKYSAIVPWRHFRGRSA